MSNQFYKYITDELINYWKDSHIRKGERYYLRLDNQDEIDQIVNTLEDTPIRKDFSYKHELGEVYKTFYLEINGVKLVVAATNEFVKPDYLALIRNEVSEQNVGWEDTALISIVNEQLDTIPGGSIDLESEGLPLHFNSLYNKINNDIKHSIMTPIEKKILENELQALKKESIFTKLSFFEFEEILNTLNKGKIEDSEYKNFGLFKDPDLDSYKGNNLTKRIEENREFFDRVQNAHNFGLNEEALQNVFSEEGSKALMNQNWTELNFSEVKKFREDFKKNNKDIKVTFDGIKCLSNHKIWDRTVDDSAASKRKRHIIVFNPNNDSKVELQAHFLLEGPAKSLSDEFLTVQNKSKNNVNCQVKISNLNIEINTKQNETTFAKVSYKHNKRSVLGAEFFIAVVPIETTLLEPQKTSYLINPLKERIEVTLKNNKLLFGEESGKGAVIHDSSLSRQDEIIIVDSSESYSIDINDGEFEEEEFIRLTLSENSKFVPVEVIVDSVKPTPISGAGIWKIVRETNQNMTWDQEEKRLFIGTRQYYMHSEYEKYFNLENEWIESGIRYARLDGDQLYPEEIKINDDLRETYSRYINYFKGKKLISSISTITDELVSRGLDYLKKYVDTIGSFEKGKPVGSAGVDLFKLGTISSEGEIYFTPFHPLMVAYKLKLYEILGNEEVNSELLSRLTPEALIPFIYNEDLQLFKPEHQTAVYEWLIFKPVNLITVSDASHYLSNVIFDKINQFNKHFNYLFLKNSKAPLKINIINIVNDQNVLSGIVKWMLLDIENNGTENVKPIEVTIYSNEVAESIFNRFAQVETPSELEELTDVKLKVKDFDEDTILRVIRENLFFYTRPDITNQEEVRYAHISFYKMHAQESHAVQQMEEMNSGITLEGLYSSVGSMRDVENYKSGFGIKTYSVSPENYLVSTAFALNELAANTRNAGNDSYLSGNSILSRTTTSDDKTLDEIFNNSHWVTFVDPNVDLEFFNKNERNLIVIHYSDQYSSSSRYDAITVTNKANQYFSVIQEFLKTKEVESSKENVINTIKAFNTFNGEWLLRIIGSKGHYDREKLSIISAIKYSLAYFEHPNIIWVPISLEELLRVAGVFNLSKSGGVLSAKNLGIKGSHSDDLLLIGLENLDGSLKLHFYPIEVKIGHNSADIITKAKTQVKQTKKVIMGLVSDEQPSPFKKLFYRNFFVQLLLANMNKIVQGDIYPDKGYNLHEEIIEKLLKFDYQVTDELSEYIGNGGVISFKKVATFRASYIEDDVQIVEFPMEDGYSGIVKPIEDAVEWIQNKPNDFRKNLLLSNLYKPSSTVSYKNTTETLKIEDIENNNPKEFEYTEPNVEEPAGKTETPNIINQDTEGNNDTEGTNGYDLTTGTTTNVDNNPGYNVASPELEVVKKPLVNKNDKVPLKDLRIKIGTARNSEKEIYWEYGHQDLANRHLVISGRSGQGKTYFMQCLLLEKSKLGISSIVVDYTEGFLFNQLEPEFVEYLGDKLKQRIVVKDKLPINPFIANTIDFGGELYTESYTDIAERVKSVFGAVYKSLGIQQLNSIYDAVITGLERYGDKMNLKILREMLEEDGSGPAKTALGQLRPFIDRDPFAEGETINWKDIRDSDGDVFVIQLTRYTRDVQLIITEFLLWDIWNFSVREGNKNKPLPVILDEAQNLDHRENSPSARILTEGRKFGWSAWYATQFLKSQLGADELARLQNASQKVYFLPPEQEISYIASSLSSDNNERKYWENTLTSLRKGECIVQGPILQSDGNLSRTDAVVVDITPLHKRI